MKCITIAAPLVFAALVILPLSQIDGIAQDSAKGCKLQGTWTGEVSYFGFRFIATYQGTGDTEGTLAMDFIDVPVPTPKMMTTARGLWAKTGPDTYDITYQVFFFENVNYGPVSVNQIGFIGLASGMIKLTSCDTADVAVTTGYFLPGADMPFIPPENATATQSRLLLYQKAPLP